MDKQERINEVENALRQIADADSTWNEWATELVNMGFGNVRAYRAKIIELYLKGNTAELVKFIMEEV